MSEQDFFGKRWHEEMNAYAAAYRSLQKPMWKLGDISAQVDKGSRKAFFGRLYDAGRIDMGYGEFDHYLQAAVAFPPDKRVLTKSWSLHFKLRNLPDRWALIKSDDFKHIKDADDEVKRRKDIADQREDEENAAERRNETEVEITFYEVWDGLTSNAEDGLKKWLADHVNYDLDLEHIMKIRRDSRILTDAWLEAIDSDFSDTLELCRAFQDSLAKVRIPF